MGCILVGVSCWMMALPHFIYGPGKEAIELAEGNVLVIGNSTSIDNVNRGKFIINIHSFYNSN